MDLGAAVALALFAATPLKPLPSRAPEAFASPTLRVHVRAHEDLDPDTLRAFARPGVTLWLETRSNLLKASTLENLSRFDAAFVRLRAGLTDGQVRSLEHAPRAGAWVDQSQLEGKGLARVLGPRPLAVQVKGPIDEALFARVKKARPEQIEWSAPADADLMSWSFFRQWPGRRLLSLEPGGMSVRACAVDDVAGGPAARVHVASLLALGSAAFPCGPGSIVVIGVETDLWILHGVLLRDPTAELEAEVGVDELAAKKVLALLDNLGFAAHR